MSLANATQQRLRAANAVHLATAAYNRWVGQPLDRTPDLEEPTAAPGADAAEPPDQLISSALERCPELAAVSAQQDALEESARAERAQGLPQVALHAGYNHWDNVILDRENFASIGIGFTWRLFDSGQLANRTSALRSRARAAGHKSWPICARWCGSRSKRRSIIETRPHSHPSRREHRRSSRRTPAYRQRAIRQRSRHQQSSPGCRDPQGRGADQPR